MSEAEASTYLLAWSAYVVGVLLLMGGGIWLTWGLKPVALRDLLWVVILATLVPWATAISFEGYWAPAFLVAVFELLFQPDGDPAGALAALTVAWGIGLLAWALWTGGRVLVGRRPSTT